MVLYMCVRVYKSVGVEVEERGWVGAEGERDRADRVT